MLACLLAYILGINSRRIRIPYLRLHRKRAFTCLLAYILGINSRRIRIPYLRLHRKRTFTCLLAYTLGNINSRRIRILVKQATYGHMK